ncbi:MAG: YjbH domain-containing protein [Rhodospirillaceae bacterium]
MDAGRVFAVLWLTGLLALGPIFVAEAEQVPSQSDAGGTGLLETPSARMMEDGSLVIGAAVVGGLYRHGQLGFQLLPWLEGTLHATLQPALDDIPSLVDSGLGLKARLATETRWRPELALGIRDLAGGRFASEYLVLNKRWYDFDFSLGLGWGRLGEAGYLPNPLGLLGGRYGEPRKIVDPLAGPGSWFTGSGTALFGGVAWKTPLPGLALKFEMSPDRRLIDRLENPALVAGSPFNLGASYRPVSWLEFGAGYEHGRDVMLRLALLLNPATESVPRLGPATLPEPTASVVIEGARAIAWLDPTRGAGDASPPARTVGRALLDMAARAPPAIEEVTVIASTRGLDGVAVSAPVSELKRAGQGFGSAAEVRTGARLEPGTTVAKLAALHEDWRPVKESPWRYQVVSRFEYSPFESTTVTAWRASVDVVSELEVADGLVYSHTGRWTPAARLEQLDGTLVRAFLGTPVNLPVRSDLIDYVYAAPINLFERAAVSWLAEPDPSWRTRLSIGWFEEMYGGVGGEALYRAPGSRLAAGVELDVVRKRLPGNTLLLRPETDTVTGHASLYYESADGRVDSALHAGRYLGGDLGATVEIARNFDNGVRIAASFTGTTGAERSGVRFPGQRDRFDGLFRLSVPLGALPLVPTASRAELVTRPLGRDSGQRLEMPLRLEPLTRPVGYGAISGGWSRLLE